MQVFNSFQELSANYGRCGKSAMTSVRNSAADVEQQVSEIMSLQERANNESTVAGKAAAYTIIGQRGSSLVTIAQKEMNDAYDSIAGTAAPDDISLAAYGKMLGIVKKVNELGFGTVIPVGEDLYNTIIEQKTAQASLVQKEVAEQTARASVPAVAQSQAG